MANLKGAKFEKQIKDAFHRTLKFGEKRHLKDDNFTHSDKVAEKRQMYLKDFKGFIEQKGINTGKLNEMMTEKNIKEFLELRTTNLSPKSSLDYVSGFNSLLKGLEQANVTIPSNPTNNDFLKDYRDNFRSEMKELEVTKGRYINNLEQKLQVLENKNFGSGVISRLQAQTGLRVSETYEVINNFQKYYNPKNNSLNAIVGKGTHIYQSKTISQNLVNKIKEVKELPKYKDYIKDLKAVGINKSHDFRVTYTKDLLNKKLENGVEYKQALKEVSKEINHHRPQMTEYYLQRS